MNSVIKPFVLRRFALLIALQTTLVFALASSTAKGAENNDGGVEQAGGAMKLDLSMHYDEARVSQIKDFRGLQKVDGIEFLVGSRVPLFGKTWTSRGKKFPESVKGILVGRRFDELHLIHHSFWPDVEGDAVAHVHLNYHDGSTYSFPVRYGVHVLDWMNLTSYEKERVSDPDTEICWRHAPYSFKAPIRLFKTKIDNPLPDKVVDTIDIVSAKSLASYVLVAAAVIDAVDVGEQEFVGDRDFDNSITIEVVDAVTGQPLEGALAIPSMEVMEEYVVGSPFRTNAKGIGSIPYPTKDTNDIGVSVSIDGYRGASKTWSAPAPKQHTFSLTPTESVEAERVH